jgi:hypothetical protein
MKVDEMPVIAWAGMVWDDKDLTPEKAEELIEEAIFEGKTMIVDVINAISACLAEQFGVPKKAQAPTGSASMEPSGSLSGSGSLTPSSIS